MTELAFELTAEDFAAFNLHHALTSGAMLGQQRRSRVGGSIAMLLLLFGVTAAISNDPVAAVIAGVLGAAVMWFGFPLIWHRSLSGQLRRMSVQGGLGVPGPRSLLLGDDGILETFGGIGLSSTWSAVERVDVTDEHVFIYIGPAMALVVPKRVGESAVATLLNEIERRRVEVAPAAG